MSRRTEAELVAYWAIDPGVYEAGREWQREADAALVDAAESEIHVLLVDESASRSQIAFNITQYLAAKLRGRA